MPSMKTIVAVFGDLDLARRGVQALQDEEVDPSRISMLLHGAQAGCHGRRLQHLATSARHVADRVRASVPGTALTIADMPALAQSVAMLLGTAGVPVLEARVYEDAVRGGKVLVMTTVCVADLGRVARALARCEPIIDIGRA